METRTVRTVVLPDGGFLVLDTVRMVRVRWKDRCYRVVVVDDRGTETAVASWMGSWSSYGSLFAKRTPEERREQIEANAAADDRARQAAEKWAEELRWIIESRD